MKLAYLIPENQYSFFGEAVAPLKALGIDVDVNRIASDCDLVLAAIMPITHEWYRPLYACGKPFVLWHWDLFSFTDYTELRWKMFLDAMDSAADVWSCSYETARQLKEVLEIDSQVLTAWVNKEELAQYGQYEGLPRSKDYALYATSGQGFGKRPEWAERACQLSGYKLKTLAGQKLPRDEYLRLMAGCRVYVMTAFEESNGSIPAIEAAALGRPVVVADIPSNREVFGETGYYFKNDDFRSLLSALRSAWTGGPLPDGRQRALRNYGGDAVFPRMARRLKELHYTLSFCWE